MFSLWERVLSYVEKNDRQYYAMFLEQLFPYSFSEGRFTIAANKAYLIQWIQNLYARKIESIIAEATGSPAAVTIILNPNTQGAPAVMPTPVTPAPIPDQTVPQPTPAAPAPMQPVPPAPVQPSMPMPAPGPTPAIPFPFPQAVPPDAPLTPPIDVASIRPKSLNEATLPSIEEEIRKKHSGRTEEMDLFSHAASTSATGKKNVLSEFTFETFVSGNCNEMAYQAALAVAEQIATDNYNRSFNPLFIYGPSGLGKTHLLRAIQNYLPTHSKNKKAVFMPSETFVNELISAIGSKTQEKFRQKYRTVDVLLLDDVQFFGKTESSAIELFNTFNNLFDNRKNIVMTSDSTPENIRDLEDRLKSRFASGLVVQISPPDFEICCAILERRAETDGVRMPQDVIEFIARHINKNIRELEGAYYSVKVYCHLSRSEITLEKAREALKSHRAFKEEKELTMDLIIDTVCRQYDVPKAKLVGKGRPKNIVIPRQIAMYLCRNDMGESYQSIADVFHKNDHTSVLQACRRVEKAISSDPTMKKTIEGLRELLKK